MIRRWPAALLAIIAFFTAWNMWAICLDQQLTLGADCLLYPALAAWNSEQSLVSLLELHTWGAKGPFTTSLTLLFSLLVGAAPVGGRLLSVLAHAAVMALCFSLGRKLTGRAVAGLWSAFVCGSAPLLFGWARLEYPEMVLAVLVLGAIHMVLRDRVDRPLPALAMGILFGLGIMTKLAFIAFMVVPGLWLLVRHLRGPRPGALFGLALTLVAMALTAGPWIVINWAEIYTNFFSSSTTSDLGVQDKVFDYLTLMGVAPLLGAAALSLVLLWRGPLIRRDLLLLLGIFLACSMFLFMVVFDSWSRYIVPALPAAAVLAGGGLVHVGRWLPRPARYAVGTLLAVATLTWFTWLNLTHIDLGPDLTDQENAPDASNKDIQLRRRDLSEGLLSPDRRAYLGYPKVARALERKVGNTAMLVFGHPDIRGRLENMQMIQQVWDFNGVGLGYMKHEDMVRELRVGMPLGVVVVRHSGMGPVDRENIQAWTRTDLSDVHAPQDLFQREHRASSWFLSQRTRLISRQKDPGGITYEAYEVLPPR